jgi:hypothetical protein
MLGANWKPDSSEKTTEKFAWWPVRSSFSKKLIWLKKYVEVFVYYDNEFSHPIRSNTWKLIYTKNEYLLYLLRKNEH